MPSHREGERCVCSITADMCIKLLTTTGGGSRRRTTTCGGYLFKLPID